MKAKTKAPKSALKSMSEKSDKKECCDENMGCSEEGKKGCGDGKCCEPTMGVRMCHAFVGAVIFLIGLDFLLAHLGYIPVHISDIVWPSLVMLLGLGGIVKVGKCHDGSSGGCCS